MQQHFPQHRRVQQNIHDLDQVEEIHCCQLWRPSFQLQKLYTNVELQSDCELQTSTGLESTQAATNAIWMEFFSDSSHAYWCCCCCCSSSSSSWRFVDPQYYNCLLLRRRKRNMRERERERGGREQRVEGGPSLFPIAPGFNPICFAQSPPLLTYLAGPKGQVFPPPTESSILESIHSFNFFVWWADQNGLLQHRRSWTCEASPTN